MMTDAVTKRGSMAVWACQFAKQQILVLSDLWPATFPGFVCDFDLCWHLVACGLVNRSSNFARPKGEYSNFKWC